MTVIMCWQMIKEMCGYSWWELGGGGGGGGGVYVKDVPNPKTYMHNVFPG